VNADLPKGTITAVTPQKHATDRYSIFIDGEFAFGVGVEVVLEFDLHPGLALDPEQVKEIQSKEEVVAATNAALHLLAYRARATGELQTRLRQKGHAPHAIEAAIEKLRGWYYLDDEDFAKTWVENRATHRPRSRRALEQELRSKGIDREVIEQTIESAELDEVSDAIRVAERKWDSWRNLPPDVRNRRLSSLLGRRGYGYDIVRAVIRHFEEDPEADTDPEIDPD
jgi:regulatory protein